MRPLADKADTVTSATIFFSVGLIDNVRNLRRGVWRGVYRIFMLALSKGAYMQIYVGSLLAVSTNLVDHPKVVGGWQDRGKDQ